jgi:hypothetical protein
LNRGTRGRESFGVKVMLGHLCMGGGITPLVSAGSAELVVVEMLAGMAMTEVIAERNERPVRNFIAARSVASERLNGERLKKRDAMRWERKICEVR